MTNPLIIKDLAELNNALLNYVTNNAEIPNKIEISLPDAKGLQEAHYNGLQELIHEGLIELTYVMEEVRNMAQFCSKLKECRNLVKFRFALGCEAVVDLTGFAKSLEFCTKLESLELTIFANDPSYSRIAVAIKSLKELTTLVLITKRFPAEALNTLNEVFSERECKINALTIIDMENPLHDENPAVIGLWAGIEGLRNLKYDFSWEMPEATRQIIERNRGQ